MVKTRMIRKQVYIEPRHEEILKQTAERWKLSEAELVRYAIDQLEKDQPPGPVRQRAWEKLKAFAEERALMQVPPTGRTWTRDDIYEDRLAKWGPDLYDLAGCPIPPNPQADKE